MSEKKKVIHVKDLVIKADNVRIEPAHRPDPFLGGRQHEAEKSQGEAKEGHQEKDDHQEKPPFSWL